MRNSNINAGNKANEKLFINLWTNSKKFTPSIFSMLTAEKSRNIINENLKHWKILQSFFKEYITPKDRLIINIMTRYLMVNRTIPLICNYP